MIITTQDSFNRNQKKAFESSVYLDFDENHSELPTISVGIVYIAIGRYACFFDEFYTSAEKYLFPNIKKHYFVFTDSIDKIESKENITCVYQEDKGWPDNTLLRFHIFLDTIDMWKTNDYMLFFNGNTKFLRFIEFDEIFPTKTENTITALKWHVYDNRCPDDYPYERRPESQAYIPLGQGLNYFQGGLFGAKTPYFIDLLKSCRKAIEIDSSKGLIARNHDESHLNRYLLDKKVSILTDEYGRPEEWDNPLRPKIIFQNKNKVLGTKYVNRLKNRRTNIVKRVIHKLSSLIK